MRRYEYPRYGTPDDIHLADAETPEPGAGEVIVRVHASSTNMGDWILLTGKPYVVRGMFGLRAPRKRVPGGDVAGVVEAVGESIERLKVGDRVFGESATGGAYSTHVRAKEDELTHIPDGVAFEAAGVTPVAGVAALQALRTADLNEHGGKVLINGVSSGVGSYAAQIVRSMGYDVHGVCSGGNTEFVRTQGVSRVYDYTREDFTASDERYDAIIDIVGNRRIKDCRRIMKADGRFVGVSGGLDNPWVGPFLYMAKLALANKRGTQRFTMLIAQPSREDLDTLAAMIARGEITPPIDRRFGFEEVPEALRHQGTGRSRGKTLISIA